MPLASASRSDVAAAIKTEKPLRIVGYPGSRRGKLYFDVSDDYKNDGRFLVHHADIEQGQSGGPVLLEVYELSGDALAQKLVNLSARAVTGTGDNTLIAGLVVRGTVPKRVLIRAAGPALAQFGLANALARPELTLRSASGAVVAQNAGWSTSPDAIAIAEAAFNTGTFAFGFACAGSPFRPLKDESE